MTATTARTSPRAPRGCSVTFPAGFVELTARQQPRHLYWERELAAYYPELDRPTTSHVLSLLASYDPAARLGPLAGELRVAVGLALDGQQIRGVSVLTITAARAPDGWSAHTLLDRLTGAAASRPRLHVRQLPCAHAMAVVVDRGGTAHQHADVFVADPVLNTVLVISAFTVVSAPLDLLSALQDMVNSYQRC